MTRGDCNEAPAEEGAGLLARLLRETRFSKQILDGPVTLRQALKWKHLVFFKRLSNTALGPAFLMRVEVCVFFITGIHARWRCLRAKWERTRLGGSSSQQVNPQGETNHNTVDQCGAVNKASIFAGQTVCAAVIESNSAFFFFFFGC